MEYTFHKPRQSRHDPHGTHRNVNQPRESPSLRSRSANSAQKQAPKEQLQSPAWNAFRLEDSQALRASSESHVIYRAPSDNTFIGVALGSPSIASAPQATREGIGSAASYTSSLSGSEYRPATEGSRQGDEISKQKGGKWKMFGGLFGKKSSVSPASPFYQVQQTSPVRSPTASQTDSVRSPRTKKNTREPTNPEIQRAHSVPLAHAAHTAELSPKPPPKDNVPNEISHWRIPETGPTLRVDIPNIQLERYSVMFGSLLNPPRPSLLERRQAQLAKLKTVGEEEDSHSNELQPPTRRATTPTPTKSPSFSLFPTPPSGTPKGPIPKHAPGPSSLQRAATAPANLSPHRLNFNFPNPNHKFKDQDQVVAMYDSPTDSTAPSSHAPKWSSDGSAPSPASSNTSNPNDSPETAHTNPSIPIKSSTPAKDPVNKQARPHIGLTRTSDKSLPKAPTNQSVGETEDPLKVAAEVSIARQISVSQRQRQLLVPIVPKTARQPLQPTLVDVSRASPDVKPGHARSKSQHVLVEDA